MNLEQKLEELKKRDRLAAEGGGEQRRERQHKEGKMSARERVEFLLDEGTFEETDKLVTHRSNDFGMAEQKYLRRRLYHRLRTNRRAAGVCVRAGLHGFRRIALGNQRREDRQDHGPGRQDGRARDWLERFGRRPHPGRRGVAGGLCRHFSAQHAVQRSGTADFRHHGAVRGRRGVLAGHHGLHPDGGKDLLHVYHRAGRDQDGHARGSQQRPAGRGAHPQRDFRRGPLHGARRCRVSFHGAGAAEFRSVEQSG